VIPEWQALQESSGAEIGFAGTGGKLSNWQLAKLYHGRTETRRKLDWEFEE